MQFERQYKKLCGGCHRLDKWGENRGFKKHLECLGCGGCLHCLLGFITISDF